MKKCIAEGAVKPLISLLVDNNSETRGFAAATLKNLATNKAAQAAIREEDGIEPLQVRDRG